MSEKVRMALRERSHRRRLEHFLKVESEKFDRLVESAQRSQQYDVERMNRVVRGIPGPP